MKRFEFTLGRIRDYKNSILDKEKNVLSGLRMEKNNIETRLDKLEKMFEEVNTEMHKEFETGMTVSKVKLYEYRKNGIREEKRLLGDRMDFLDASIERQMKRVQNLKQEVSGYDKLEEKQREEYNKAAEKEQNDIIAEFVSQKITRELNEQKVV